VTGIITPDQIAHELRDVNDRADKGAETIRYHEARSLAAERAWQESYDEGYAGAEGTIAEREIAGRTAARVFKQTWDNEKADLAWAKNEVRRLEAKQSNLQSQLKAITVAMTS
jgi:hypothetical protein